MELRLVVERKSYYFGFTLGLTVVLVLLDYFNPFVNFYETWNMHYVVNNLGWFMIFLVPIFFVLGIIAQWDGMSDLFFSCVLIPIYYFFLKGLLFLLLIAQDPNLSHVIGTWYGGYVLDWRDFSIVYFFSLPLFMLFVWRYCLGFLVLGYVASHVFGKSVRNVARATYSRLTRRSKGDSGLNRQGERFSSASDNGNCSESPEAEKGSERPIEIQNQSSTAKSKYAGKQSSPTGIA